MTSGLMEAFVIIAAIAIVLQMLILLGLYLQVKAALAKLDRVTNDLQSKINPILIRVNRILEDSEERISSIMGDAAELTRVARTQAQKFDRVFTEALERLRIQILRADVILTGALEVIEDTGSKFRNTVWGPVQKATAIIRGIKIGLDYLRRGQRQRSADGEPATQDEELFI